MNKWPETLQEAIQYFSDYDNCHKFMVAMRWPHGKVACPTCGSEKVTFLAKQRRFKCYAKHPKAQFSIKVGTIMEDSPLGLDKWLPAAWLILNCKNGISSYELSRDLKITQKSTWFMLHRIRLMMQDDLAGGTLGGEIEIDESFMGGKARNMHRIRRNKVNMQANNKGKTLVLGILQRETEGRPKKIRATVVPDRKRETMEENVLPAVEPASKLFTDEHGYYWGQNGFEHEVINHAEQYVRDNVHTNGLENFWSLLKRGINGTYVSVEPFHLFRYVDEQAFRFNNRKMTDGERFTEAMRQIVGRRLTYEELTGKTEKQPG
jgi:transposase-like protein